MKITPVNVPDLKINVTYEKTMHVVTDAFSDNNDVKMHKLEHDEDNADFVPVGRREVKREDLLEHRDKDVKQKPSILARMIHEVSMLFKRT